MKKFIAGAALALIVASAGGTAFAGEVTGGPNPKPNKGGDKASSECAFSGQEDGITFTGVDENGAPQFEDVPTGPGLVQNPHQENSAGVIHEPGVAGTACRGNLPPGNGE